MSSAFYGGAYLLLIGAVSYLAYLSHIPGSYIVAFAMIMLGIAVVSGMESARERNSSYRRRQNFF